MPKRDRAAYMRDYRARGRAGEPIGDRQTIRIAELEEEVARLKRELAKPPIQAGPTFNSRPFTPVPKK
jgi:hypothetical protein